MRAGVAAVLVALLTLASTPGEAHKPSDSYLTLVQGAQGTQLEGQWDIALRDLEHAIGLDANGDGSITWGELKARQDAVTRYALTRLVVEALGRGERSACALGPGGLLFDRHVDGGYAVLRFRAQCALRPAQLNVHYALLFDVDPNHRGLIDVRTATLTQALVLSAAHPVATLDLQSPDRLGQFRAFMDEGIWHIWKGYDHILFLLTLLFPAVLVYAGGRWMPKARLSDALLDVLKIVTAFTLAHSLTLSLSTLGFVNLPSRWVESGIALTVLLGALNNLFPLIRDRRWTVAFAFGLIHGLGFASVLADLGLTGWNLALALIGFNLGVEAGQLAIVLCFVPAAFALRATIFYRRAFVPGGAATIGAVALYWLAVRVSGAAL